MQRPRTRAMTRASSTGASCVAVAITIGPSVAGGGAWTASHCRLWPEVLMAAWQLNGNVLIACNCDWGCPCNFNARPSRGKCEGGWIWAIGKGHVGDVRLDGLGAALFADWPGAIHEGGGRAVCYMDARANA